ncbi:MAG: polysaccharide biosynthesis tyrosine autokinase [Alphaproteobacteria bacterium]|nr:MAG: polysaccharide biosynthesis tyrosine autokinase [Alphaproteobacteria bacterium]
MNAQTRTVWNDIVSASRTHMQGMEWSMSGTISMIFRRWQVLAASVVVCMALAVLMLMVMKPAYTSNTLMQINTRTEQVSNVQDVVSGIATTDASIRTEVDVLTSRKLAARVVERLGLLNEPASNGGFFGNLKNLVSVVFMPMKDDAEQKVDRQERMSRAVSGLLGSLNVTLIPRSFTINVQYTSGSPEMAAKVANAIAQEYLNSQLEDKFETTRRANEWINSRLDDMRRSVQATQLAAEKFREANNLTSANGILLSDQQLSELNSQLILARTKLAEEQAKYTQTSNMQRNGGRGIESAAEVLGNALITNLRQQETEVRREMAELASRYGERHPRMVTVRNQLGDLRRKIGEEVYKIQGSLENNVAIAQARVNTLQEQLDALQQKTSLTNDAAVQLAELERQADAEKALYESFLSRSKEIAQMDFVQSDARVISPAEVPLNPSKPNKMLIIVLGLLAGLGIGGALMLLLEALDAGFRTSNQVEKDLGEPVLGMLSELPAGEDLANYVVNKPTSAYTEGLRSVRTAMQFAHPDKPVQALAVSSSIPEEGKSLFALSLAQLCAQGGQKVLLVDGDMRRPSLANQLKLTPKGGLAELLVGQAKFKDVAVKLPDSNLTVLPSMPNAQFSQELLASKKMQELMDEWRTNYDMIIIDSPPIMAVSDAITTASLCDSMIYMVRWGSTPRALAANAIKTLRACHVNLTGCVITRVDLDKQLTYSHGEYGYYHGKYKGYYSE